MPEYVLAPVDDEICLRIGRVVTRWTVLEKSISLLLGTALLADQSAMSVNHQQGFDIYPDQVDTHPLEFSRA